MARFYSLSTNSGPVLSGSSRLVNPTIEDNYINIVKVKVTPADGISTCMFEVFKKDTALPADLVYKMTACPGAFVDPIDKLGGLLSEGTHGHIFPYEDEDATDELHIKITNTSSKKMAFSVEIIYEVPTFTGVDPDLPPLTPQIFTNFGDTNLWLPVVPPYSKFGLTYTINTGGSVTFRSEKTIAAAYMAILFVSRFWVVPGTTNGEIKFRTKWTNINLNSTGGYKESMTAQMCCALLSCLSGDRFSWSGNFAYSVHGVSNKVSIGREHSTLPFPHNVLGWNGQQEETVSYPLSSLQMRFNHGRFSNLYGAYNAHGKDERVSLYSLNGGGWVSPAISIGVQTDGASHATRQRIAFGFYFKDYVDTGLYATITELELEKGLFIPA